MKIIGKNSESITVILLIAQLVLTAIPLFDREKNEAENELNRLRIEETKLNIEKLKKDLRKDEINTETMHQAADAVGSSLKVIKRKSNFYSHLQKCHKVTKIGFSALSDNFIPVSEELIIPRTEFSKFILTSNKLRSIEDEKAIIEIISPVLIEGRYKWKGIYGDKIISFEMQDAAFRDSVLLENIPFQHG